MTVKSDEAALNVDFRRKVIRPDLPGNYRPRPGFYLHEKLATLQKGDAPAVLFNGNNVGYWGNQFVIENGSLKYKRKGPLFDDGRLLMHATGDHAFFLGSGGFRIETLHIVASRPSAETSTILMESRDELPNVGLSGFRLIRNGESVWREHGEFAWDPGLLFDLGPLMGKQVDLRGIVRDQLDSGAELARHPMTIIGLNRQSDVVLMVSERSTNSRAVTVAEAADLLLNSFDVRDAIVLGAAGDAQLATTSEGFLTEPFVAEHARSSARRVPPRLLSSELRGRRIYARPVPCYVLLRIVDPAVAAASAHQRIGRDDVDRSGLRDLQASEPTATTRHAGDPRDRSSLRAGGTG